MDLNEILTRYHKQIVDTWTHQMLNDKSSKYADENPNELAVLIDRATKCFRMALVDDQWDELHKFINFIAIKRLHGGFSLSEVQRAFERYRETVIPLLVANIEYSNLIPVMLRLHKCLVSTVTHFSTFFQNLHEQFLRNQTMHLEQEVADRTRKLAESERKYKILVEDINDGYFVLVNGKIVFANNAFARMHGYKSDDVIGRHYLEFVAPESREAVKKAYIDSHSGSFSTPRIEYLRLHKDERHLATEIIAKLSSYGGDVANIGICRDISERVELEKKTREAEKLGALAKLAASLAHEINNPLTAIKMNLQMLSEADFPEETRQKLMSSTLKEAEQISRCITEMMNLTVPFRLKYQWVNIPRLIKNCLQVVEQRMIYQKVKTSTRFSPKVKNIFVDPERIEQAIVNLLLNSLDAVSRDGRIFINTSAENSEGKAWVNIRIADDGPGIPKEKLQYVFDPFYSQKPGGIGLGLGNVKKIIEAHGGKVIVTQRRPKGVVFTLRIPQNEKPDES